jgi:large subunit ribosomal protein L6
MSRVGKQPIVLPEGVKATINATQITINGPKGELVVEIPQKVHVEQKENELLVSVLKPEDSRQAAFWGLSRSLIANAVKGVTEGFEKKLEVNGVGYKVQLQGKKLTLNVGYSHSVDFELPEGIESTVEGNTISINGISKQLVGEIAANIRKIRKPEPYKGKGIKYSDEQIRRKVGKVVKGSEA